MKVKDGVYLNKADLDTLLLDFIECAIHQIIYYRNVYPKDAFTTFQKYNLKVKGVRFRQIDDYIKSSLSGLVKCRDKGILSQIVLEIINLSTDKIVEKYVFQNVAFASNTNNQLSSFTKEDLYIKFRDHLSTLNALGSTVPILDVLNDESQNISFQIVAVTAKSSSNPGQLGLDVDNWIGSEIPTAHNPNSECELTPIIHCPLGLFAFQLHLISTT